MLHLSRSDFYVIINFHLEYCVRPNPWVMLFSICGSVRNVVDTWRSFLNPFCWMCNIGMPYNVEENYCSLEPEFPLNTDCELFKVTLLFWWLEKHIFKIICVMHFCYVQCDFVLCWSCIFLESMLVLSSLCKLVIPMLFAH